MRNLKAWCKQTISQGANKGFTLVELLIVIAIIAILVSIAIPHYAEIRRTAIHATMLSDLKNCINKAEAWGAHNKSYTGFDVEDWCVVTHTNNLIVANVTPNGYTITVTNSEAPAGKTTCTIVSGGQITCS